MPNISANYDLTLPLTNENYDINIFNENFEKIDTALYNIENNAGGIIYNGKSTTAGATNNKIVATTEGNFEKINGALIIVEFTNNNTASSPSLNIDGTGASNIYVNTGIPTTSQIVGGQRHLFQYDLAANRFYLLNPNYTYDIGLKASQSDLATLQTQVNNIASGSTIYQGTCATAAATTAKVGTVSGTFARVDGALALLTFTYTVTNSSPTLNINSTGASAIYVDNTAVAANQIVAGGRYLFQYNATNNRWQLLNPSYTAAINDKVSATTYNTGIATKLNKAGDTATGNIVSYNPPPATSGVRNIYAGLNEMESGVSSLPTGVIYFQYE